MKQGKESSRSRIQMADRDGKENQMMREKRQKQRRGGRRKQGKECSRSRI